MSTREIIVNKLNKEKNKFLAGWVGVHIVGWYLGPLIGFCGGTLFFARISSIAPQSAIFDAISTFFIWTTHGAWIGIAQFFILKKWKIQPFLWIIATSLSWGISATIIVWYHDNVFVEQFGYSITYKYWFYGIGIFLIGLSVGFAQVTVMGNAFSKRGLWVLANASGLVLCVLASFGILYLLIPLLPSEAGIGARDFDFLIDIIFLFTLPLPGIIPALATGLYLINFCFDSAIRNDDAFSVESY